MKKNYNTTQLDPDKAFERHVFHRDQFAHYLRWMHVLKVLRENKTKASILDWGCGSANLAEVAYRNRVIPKSYLGVDIREKVIQKLDQVWKERDWASFATMDLCNPLLTKAGSPNKYDIVTSFEVIEHIGKENADQFLKNMAGFCHKDTIILLSTPIYDEKVGPAANHVINGENGEFGYQELYDHLTKYFEIEKVYGTFASIKDYKKELSKEKLQIYEELKSYYDSEMMSVIMAPLIEPWQSRNAIWRLKLK